MISSQNFYVFLFTIKGDCAIIEDGEFCEEERCTLTPFAETKSNIILSNEGGHIYGKKV